MNKSISEIPVPGKPDKSPKGHFDGPATISPKASLGEVTFGGLGIAPKLLDEILKLGFEIPTSIQHKAITPAIEGKDVIGGAQHAGTDRDRIVSRRAVGRGTGA